MRKNPEKPRQGSQRLGRIIWGNILRQQYLLGITDTQLCEVLGVTPRTLLNYRKAPTAITLRQLQALLVSFGVDAETLLRQ